LSKLKDKSHRHDVFHRRAKQQGFAARSVFKLEEIDQRLKLFRPGDRVLDLGCRPGSWLQYAAQKVDVVLSDMAPDTSGVRSMDQARSEGLFERALWIAEQTLAPGGHFVGKLFMGPDWQKLQKRVRDGFGELKTIKPASSRKESIEQYVCGLFKK
jgi:23S rRNA (uridine2552-2'-O)-methyltransferase